MKRWLGSCIFIGAAACAVAQIPETPPARPEPRRLFLGFRVRGFESNVLGGRTVNTENATAKTSQIFTTDTSARQLSVGPTVEMRIRGKLSISGEAFYHRPSYRKVTRSYTGTDDPSTSTDERTLKSTVTETTKATYWDFPVVLRYRGLKRAGLLSHAFVEGGWALRTVSSIATGNETVFSDGTTGYNENRAQPAVRNLRGMVGGAGFRFVDAFGVKVTPQARYTYWSGESFQADSTRSRRNQFEIGIGLSF
jgi:hypothetical protein